MHMHDCAQDSRCTTKVFNKHSKLRFAKYVLADADVHGWMCTIMLTCVCVRRSLGVFTERSVIRRLCMSMITNIYFEGFVLVLVLLSSVLLALDTPSLDDSSRLAQVITICDIIFVACFTLEMCLKVGVCECVCVCVCV